jgi:hypothetical protein
LRKNSKYAGLVDNYVGNKGPARKQKGQRKQCPLSGGGGWLGQGETARNKATMQMIGCIYTTFNAF